jgi:hypothetical protein
VSGAEAFICVCVGLTVTAILAAIIQHERYASKGRRLIEAAGSEELAELEIRRIHDSRFLNELLRHKSRAKPRTNNVVRFVPRITSRGREVRFGPDGAA